MAKFKVANNTTSYDIGTKPYKGDDNRGTWSSNWDFFCACLTHSFDLKAFSIVPLFMLQHGVVFFFFPFIIGMILFIIPIYFIQSFLGQFSSSGFISAFRIAPLFKGIGYVILILNLTSTMYYGSFAGLPLIYFFNSFNPNLPWSHCNNSWNTNKCQVKFNLSMELSEFSFDENVTGNYNSSYDDYTDNYWERTWPALEFMHVSMESIGNGEWHFAWRLFLCTGFVWVILAYVLTRGLQTFGKIMRYTAITLVAILGILIIRLLFAHGSIAGLKEFFIPKYTRYWYRIETWLLVPFIAATAFGSGWSTTLSLASYNNFKCDIGKISVMISFSHMLIAMICALMVYIVEATIVEEMFFNYEVYGDKPIQYVYTTFPLYFTKIGWSNLWSLLFFLMLFLAEFSTLSIQMFSILTALFDEYDQLRTFKKEITIGLISIIAVFSIFFCTNHGTTIAVMLYESTSWSQMLISFVELMIVVWVYGRMRFQRDVQFMLGHLYPTWRFYLIRFITPFYIFLALLVSIAFSIFSRVFHYGEGIEIIYLFLANFVKLLPIIFIPVYMIVKITISSGSILNRMKRLCRPNDWYPANKIDRDRYEITIGSAADIAQQLIVEDFEEP